MRILKAFLKGYTAVLRLFIITLIGSVVFLPLMSKAGSAQAISLKYNTVLNDNMITLGDIFENLPRSADPSYVLGAAPRPGNDMTLNARTLLRIAVALDLPWRPGTSADQVTLRRAGTLIDDETITKALQEKIAAQGFAGKYKVTLPDHLDNIALPEELPPTLAVKDLKVKADQDSFQAVIVAPSEDNPVQTINISGSLQRMVDVPVLRESLKHGMTIGRHDLDWIEIPERSLKHNTVVREEELLGLTPRRLITPGQPIITADIEQPRVVERGDVVTMIFSSGALNLTAQGKALEHGAKGDVIRVVNTTSNKSVEAQVSGEREVTISQF